MRILAHQGEGKLVGLRLADKFGTGGEELLHHRS